MSDSLQPHEPQHTRPPSLSITNSWSRPKPVSIESVMPSNHLILCHPLLLLPSIFASIRVFSNESTLCIRWPKYRSFSFNISPSSEHPGLTSFRMDWLDLFIWGLLCASVSCLLYWSPSGFRETSRGQRIHSAKPWSLSSGFTEAESRVVVSGGQRGLLVVVQWLQGF